MTSLSSKKGVLDIEFIVSVMVFLTAIAFVSVSIVNTVPKLHQESFSQDLKSKAFQISELLLFDVGEPSNWHTIIQTNDNTVQRLGLSNGTRYFISRAKVTALVAYCATTGKYDKTKAFLGLDYTNDIIINVTDIDAGTSQVCGPSVTSQIRAKADITRLGIDESTNKILKITVSIL